MSSIKVLSLPGDGVGPEVNNQARRVLTLIADAAGVGVEVEEAPFGGAAIDDCGKPLPDTVSELAAHADAVLLGAVGGPQWDSIEVSLRPERGLLALRKEMGVFANLRPARFFPALSAASPLRPELTKGADVLIVRELLGGIYFGEPRGETETEGYDTLRYSSSEVTRIVEIACELAAGRSGRVTSVDKANVLASMRVWRRAATAVGAAHTEIEMDHQYVDSAAMKLVTQPKSFDVIVTGNMFGDILSDAAAALTGSLGMLPSASIGDGPALYEPIHGSAPDIAGKGIANPLGAILSVGMMATNTLERPDLERVLQAAVEHVLDSGIRTRDLAPFGTSAVCSTEEMGDAVVARLRQSLSSPGNLHV
ncbi:MAG: 3-isopropylmalate dehydrogenase [Bradymonadia bacterium]|jgi:3-isopropylmalate dehydrogenase